MNIPLNPYGPPQEQWDAQFESANRWIREHVPVIVMVVLGLAVALWLASGCYMVTSGHVGVVRTFGKETDRTQAGLHYRFPWPFQSVDIVNVEQIRRAQLGFREGQRAHEEALMLTGDENGRGSNGRAVSYIRPLKVPIPAARSRGNAAHRNRGGAS